MCYNSLLLQKKRKKHFLNISGFPFPFMSQSERVPGERRWERSRKVWRWRDAATVREGEKGERGKDESCLHFKMD